MTKMQVAQPTLKLRPQVVKQGPHPNVPPYSSYMGESRAQTTPMSAGLPNDDNLVSNTQQEECHQEGHSLEGIYDDTTIMGQSQLPFETSGGSTPLGAQLN
jgi:hypothetical protein